MTEWQNKCYTGYLKTEESQVGLATCCHRRLREGRTVLGRSNVFDGRQTRMEKLDCPMCSTRGGL